ncbi:MAG: hypothetical protein RL033_8094 [Pseudomonadota bacterium]
MWGRAVIQATQDGTRFRRAVVAVPVLLGVACSSGHRSRTLGDGVDLHHATLDAGAATGPETVPESADADAGAPTEQADAADTAASQCGNGVLDPEEECEPDATLAASCAEHGFDTGLLHCAADCRFDTTGCSGIESCFDGRDNDGDGLMDCADTAQCAGSCDNPCLAPPVLLDGATVSGSTRGRTAMLAASCSEPTSGADVVYQITVDHDAKLDVRLSSTQALNLSLRSSCAEAPSELTCGSQTRLTVDALAGETYFIVIDGESATDAGDYQLEAQTREVQCGDGIRDTSEGCDDGNLDGGDGCSSTCTLQATETEPNNFRFSADNFDATPWIAKIGSATDVDYVRVVVPVAPGSIIVRTEDLGDNACAYNLMDTVIEILDTNANDNALLVSDDDGGTGKCSLAVATGLTTGTYFVRIKAGDGAAPASFPYRLDLVVGACGDGERDLAEECDDGNLDSGDGCDADCNAEARP